MSFPVFGFPKPSDDYAAKHGLSLDELLVARPGATQFLVADTDVLKRWGICKGDLVILDRSVTPGHRDLVVAVIGGQFRMGFLNSDERSLWTPDEVLSLPEGDYAIEGTITSSIRLWRRPAGLS